MMIKKIKRAFVLGMTALVLFAGMPVPKVLAADNAPVHTQVTSYRSGNSQKVTYRLYLDKSKVTDGRVVLEYDPEVLSLTNEVIAYKFNESDINENYDSGDGAALSYAFVNDNPRTVNGKFFVVNFTVKAGVDNQNTAIKAYIEGINNEEETILSDVTLEDSVSVGRPLPSKPTGFRLGQTLIGFAGCWKAAANAEGYVVYRSESKNGKYEERGTTRTLFFYDPDVKNNKTYYYKITSYQMRDGKRIESEATEPVSGTIKKFFGWFG